MRPVSSRFLQSSSSFGRASLSHRVRARQRKEKKKRMRSVPSHESARFSRPLLALRSFYPFFLSFFLLSLSLINDSPLPSSPLSLSLSSSSRVVRNVIAHEVSPQSHSFSFSPSTEALLLFQVLFLGGSCIPCSPFPFLPFVLLFSRGWLPFSTRVRARVYLPLTATTIAAAASATTSFFLSFLFFFFFYSCRSRCSALFEFKRGSRRCLVSPS